MFEQVLPGNTQTSLALLGKSEILKDAYLAGGTACALHLGHRISYDLDFFTGKKFNEKAVARELKKIEKFHLEEIRWQTIFGKISEYKFSLFYYEYPLIAPVKRYKGIKIVDLKDIAAMKIDAVSTRGTKRDFVDLYFICKENLSLKKAILLYDKKYHNIENMQFHILKSLTYFENAEPEAMPKMLKNISWDQVKKFFVAEAKRLVNQRSL